MSGGYLRRHPKLQWRSEDAPGDRRDGSKENSGDGEKHHTGGSVAAQDGAQTGASGPCAGGVHKAPSGQARDAGTHRPWELSQGTKGV